MLRTDGAPPLTILIAGFVVSSKQFFTYRGNARLDFNFATNQGFALFAVKSNLKRCYRQFQLLQTRTS